MKKYILHFLKLIKSLILRPLQTLKWIKEDYKKDSLSGQYNSKYKFVWCAGLPKSGTTLIEKIFDNLPYVRQNNSFNRIFYTGFLEHDHGITNDMFSNFPKNKYSCLLCNAIFYRSIYKSFFLFF